VRAWAHDVFSFPLPPGHRLPAGKYARLRARVEAERTVAEITVPCAVAWDDLALVHDSAYLERVRCGGMTPREQRVLGLPWSPQLVHRARRATQATIEAARDARAGGLGLNLGGGTHHAGRASARGFCLFNDVAVALAALRREDGPLRALVVDCDVHQGDGTAELFADDPDTFTLSIHGAQNYPFRRPPSDLDVDVRTGAGDAEYLAALDDALTRALTAGPYDHAVYLAGADPWEGDALGRLALTKRGLRARDERVLDVLRAAGPDVTVVLAGGYAPDLEDTVEINVGTVAAVAARAPAAA
jgi:acetoin utilization deacetylase AcuC-like enzyme